MSHSASEQNLKEQELERLHKSNVELVKQLLKDLDCKNQVSLLCKPLILVSSIICLIGCFFSGYYVQQVFLNDVSHSYLDDNFQSRNVLAAELTFPTSSPPKITAEDATLLKDIFEEKKKEFASDMRRFKVIAGGEKQLTGEEACQWIAAYTAENPKQLNDKYVGMDEMYKPDENVGIKQCTPKTNDPRTNSIIEQENLNKHMTSAYPIYHLSEIVAMTQFVAAKKQQPEYNTIYKGTFGVQQFINRILNTKQWAFYHPEDYYLDQDGEFHVGNENPENPAASEFKLAEPTEHKLSYEELLFNAKSALSSETQFINDCGRNNKGKIDREGGQTFVSNGVFIGLVGPRFERQNKMEYEVGCGKMVESVPECKCDEKEDFHVQKHDAFTKTRANKVKECINLKLLRERYQISMELFLFDAQYRGAKYEGGGGVYARIVGAGAGYFAFDYSEEGQHAAYEQLIRSIMNIVEAHSEKLSNIKVLDLFHFRAGGSTIGGQARIKSYLSKHTSQWKWTGNSPNEKLEFTSKTNTISMIWSTNEMAQKTELTEGKLLVVSNAMDSNSFPGNEYYIGMAMGSGEPASAACSTIVWTQNPKFNADYISAKNAVVYTSNGDRFESKFDEQGNYILTTKR